MEPMGAILEGEWGSFSGTYAAEEADFMALLLNNGSALAGDSSLEVPSSFWPGHGSYYSSNMGNTNFYGFSQGSSYTGGSSNQHSGYLSDSHQILAPSSSSMSMDYCMVDMKNSSSFFIEGDDFLNHESSDGNAEDSAGNVPAAALPEKDAQLKRKSEMPQPDSIPEEKCDNPSGNPKKRSRSSADVQRRNKRTVQPRKNQKAIINEEDSNTGLSGQAPSNCSSDDDCDPSQELTGGGTSLSSAKRSASQNSGKTRASRGSATDPQSLYARKRRERINERLKILQNLVPNGTKVDISTMLEEAVQYVKFLQLQIKLLSSDDLWMYAPLAYNGMDIGLDLKINLPRQSP